MAEVGIESPTFRSGVRDSTSRPSRSPRYNAVEFVKENTNSIN